VKCVLLHLLFSGLLFGQTRMVAFGREVASADVGAMLKAVSDGYAAKYGLAPSEEELAPLRKKFGQVKGERLIVDFPYLVISSWKLNRVWWAKHQGRLVLSAFGVHLATDAMLREIVEMEKGGDVRFLDVEARKQVFDHLAAYRGDGALSGGQAKRLLDDGWLK